MGETVKEEGPYFEIVHFVKGEEELDAYLDEPGEYGRVARAIKDLIEQEQEVHFLPNVRSFEDIPPVPLNREIGVGGACREISIPNRVQQLRTLRFSNVHIYEKISVSIFEELAHLEASVGES